MIKTLGIILWNFQGHGVARVVIQLLPIFRHMGIRCVVMTGNDPKDDTLPFPEDDGIARVDIGYGEDRQKRLRKVLIDNQVQVVVDHEYYELARLRADWETVKGCHAKFIVHFHSVFSQFLVSKVVFSVYSELMHFYPKVDGLIALNRVDACYFQAIGCNALNIQNPVEMRSGWDETNNPEDDGHYLIWIGRIDENKRLDEAVRIMSHVLKTCPTAKLHVLGSPVGDCAEKVVRMVNANDVLVQHVVFEGFHSDVESYL